MTLINIKKKVSNKPKTPPEASPYFPLIDKITLTLRLPPADYGAIHKKVYQAIQNTSFFLPAKKSARFSVVQLIAIPGSTERVHFMFDAKKSNLPDARFNFNPAKLGPAGMDSLHEVVGTMFPGGWGYIVEHARVSELDIAVDLLGARMHHFHLLPDQVLTWKTYEDKGKLKTVYNGKPGGNQLKAYSKSHQLWVQAKKKGPKGPPIVRIEKRLRRQKKVLKDLPSLDNPFAGFKLVTHPLGPPPNESEKWKWFWPVFLDSVAARGLGPALKQLPQNRMSTYRKHFAAHAQPWWDPEAIWTYWPEVLKQSKLLTL